MCRLYTTSSLMVGMNSGGSRESISVRKARQSLAPPTKTTGVANLADPGNRSITHANPVSAAKYWYHGDAKKNQQTHSYRTTQRRSPLFTTQQEGAVQA